MSRDERIPRRGRYATCPSASSKTGSSLLFIVSLFLFLSRAISSPLPVSLPGRPVSRDYFSLVQFLMGGINIARVTGHSLSLLFPKEVRVREASVCVCVCVGKMPEHTHTHGGGRRKKDYRCGASVRGGNKSDCVRASGQIIRYYTGVSVYQLQGGGLDVRPCLRSRIHARTRVFNACIYTRARASGRERWLPRRSHQHARGLFH